ncbi:MAG TPA: vitamin B12-dependent ribonucleotide reductase, partial [Acidobacteriaceae bacterium]
RINASNPCSEYMFLDDSACNLASFNLMKFLTPGGQFDIPAYRHAIGILTTAMEIIVDAAGYPTEQISRNSHDYRPLGLGYANLGALLMDFGLPYDSDAGRAFAATVTAILCGDAYAQSARIAESCPPLGAATPLTQGADRDGGACPGFYVNREPFLDVIRMHRAEVNNIDKNLKPIAARSPNDLSSRSAAEGSAFADAQGFIIPQLAELKSAAQLAWDEALVLGEQFGYRNSQVTVLAPTGTIGFMMDCDTTGVEPDLALVKYKKLVGGGMIKIVNNTVPGALFKLGYKDAEVQGIVNYIDATGTIEGAPAIKPEHLSVFDCSFKPSKGTRSIAWLGHVKMMAATQPFLSGAISKTVNLPTDCTAEDIAAAYTEAWRLGLKAVAIYRDGSKGTQPLNVSAVDKKDEKKSDSATDPGAPSVTQSRVGDDATVAALLAANAQTTSDAASTREELIASNLRLAAAEQELARTRADLNRQLDQLRRTITEGNDALARGSNLEAAQAPPRAVRHRMPAERASITHKFSVGGHEGYVTVGLYPNGQPGEIFIRMAKEGSTISGLMDSFATAASLCLQHGVPLKVLCEKFAHTRFEPSGWTGDEKIGYAKSLMDYLFRWMQLRFLSGEQLDLFANLKPKESLEIAATTPALASGEEKNVVILSDSEGPASAPAYASGTTLPDLYASEEPSPHEPHNDAFSTHDFNEFTDRRPPQQGIAPDLTASSGLSQSSVISTGALSERSESMGGAERPAFGIEDRGLYHTATAMKSMYEMGDSPSCSTCGAIMTRNGSCYRCMECGSTSGCS